MATKSGKSGIKKTPNTFDMAVKAEKLEPAQIKKVRWFMVNDTLYPSKY